MLSGEEEEEEEEEEEDDDEWLLIHIVDWLLSWCNYKITTVKEDKIAQTCVLQLKYWSVQRANRGP